MSLEVRNAVSLKPYNSFALEAQAEHWVQVHDEQQVREALRLAEQQRWPVLVLGGGSNLVLTQDQPGLVMQMAGLGRRILQDTSDTVVVEAEAGENWHAFVCWTLQQGLSGLENLSLIPGTVGAAPVQNIGAYGVEIKDVFAGLTALDRNSAELRDFQPGECGFAYRESLFKREPGRWVILRVRFSLSRKARLHLSYGPVLQRLQQEGVAQPTAQDVSRVICQIRSEKLPDPAVLGNAGSFFKNPLISAEHAARLRDQYPDLVEYTQADGQVKLAAGWMIERAGFKGYREGDAGVHRLQALVLVNYGAATGQQIIALAQQIQYKIQQLFEVTLEIEPNVL